MVEIKIAPAQNTSLPKDCFVSVRIGEAQKLSKFEGPRSYNFRDDAKLGHGKIEVFRRIGGCHVDLFSFQEGLREVNIASSDLDIADFGLEIEVQPSNKVQSASMAQRKKTFAKDYLGQHKIEMRLGEAMVALLRELPKDPMQFLSNFLAQAAKVQPARAKFSPDEQPKRDGSVVPKTAEPGGGEFCRQGCPWNLRPSVSTWLHYSRPKLAADSLPAPEQASPVQPTDHRPAFPFRPSVGSWLQHPRRQQQICQTQAADRRPAFPFRPSVASWFMTSAARSSPRWSDLACDEALSKKRTES